MNNRGTSVCIRAAFADSRAWATVTPAFSASWEVAWMVRPSASGSEKGIPSSIASAPAPAAASTNAGVSAGRGYPTVRYAISARPPSSRSRANIGAIRLTRSRSHPGGGAPDDIQVFVATTREVDQDDVVSGKLRRECHRVGDRVGALQGWDDALQSRGLMKGVKRLLIRHADVLGPLRIMQEGVLRPNARIVKTRGDGVGREHLAVVILQ